MGTYFNPPQELPNVARKIEGTSYVELVAQLHDGEKLFGHYDRFIFQNAPYLNSEGEYEEFQRQCRQGMIMLLGFYAMSKEVFEKEFAKFWQ